MIPARAVRCFVTPDIIPSRRGVKAHAQFDGKPHRTALFTLPTMLRYFRLFSEKKPTFIKHVLSSVVCGVVDPVQCIVGPLCLLHGEHKGDRTLMSRLPMIPSVRHVTNVKLTL